MSAACRLVSSIDIWVLVWIATYILLTLRHLFGGLSCNVVAVDTGPPIVAWWRRHVLRTKAGFALEFCCICATCVMCCASRLMSDRGAALAVFIVGVVGALPGLASGLLLAWDASLMQRQLPVLRHFGAAFAVLLISSVCGMALGELLYQVCSSDMMMAQRDWTDLSLSPLPCAVHGCVWARPRRRPRI